MNTEFLIAHKTHCTRKGSALMDIPRPVTYTLEDFLTWRENESLEIQPKFQRRGVWNSKQRSYFIDTMLREMPSPPIYLRNRYDLEKSHVIHEVIDGQQRLRAVLDFYEDEFAISSNRDAEYRGLRYSKLSPAQKLLIRKYKFNCETFEAITDKEVYEVFRRMNTYSTPLSKQELRHGKFFGHFSQACEELAMDYLEFWSTNRILSDHKITRMAEVQLTSTLLISQIDGLQNTNKSIDKFYDDYDDSFPGRSQHAKHFRNVIDEISESLGDALPESQFRQPAFFYTLFGAIYHRMFGMPKAKLATKKKSLMPDDRDALKNACSKLSKIIELAKLEQKLTKEINEPRESRIPEKFKRFTDACLSQTDSLAPREVRFSTLYSEAFG